MVCPRIKNAILAKKLSNARPLPFVLGDKRKQKRRRGSPGPQVILSVLFLGEPPHRYHKNQRYNKGLRPRGFGPPHVFSPAPNRTPGPLGSLFIRVGFGSMVRVDFPEKKIDKVTRGFRGFPPDASFSPFFAERKGVPARHECIKNHALLNGSGLRATHFWPEPQK